MSKGHSSIGPSVLHRRLACPGSRRMEAMYKQPPSNKYAEEGTAKHMLVAEWLESVFHKKVMPKTQASIGRTITTPEGSTFTIDKDFVEDCKLCVNEVIRQQQSFEEMGKINVEKEFDLSDLYPDLRGTNDCSMIVEDFTIVWDWKFGTHYVEVENNPQLMAYALGAIKGIGAAELQLGIVQPRTIHGEKIRYWLVSISDLLKWKDEILIPGLKATEDPEAPCIPGDHCKYCLHHANCSAARKEVMKVCESTFKKQSLPDIDKLTDKQCAKLLDFKEKFTAFIKAVEAKILQDWERGTDPPKGWKVVGGRRSKEWKSSVPGPMLELLLGTKYDEPKLLSPARAVAVAKETGDSEIISAVNALITTNQKPGLVREDDKRPAITNNLATVFNKQGE